MKTALAILITLATTLTIPAYGEILSNDRTDIELTTFVPCAVGGSGENLVLSGPVHTLISLTMNGKNISGYFHFQPQGISGTGETTGAKYNAVGMIKQSFKSSLQNGQASFTFVNNFRIVGQGPGNNFLMHETFHFTVNAAGTITAFHDNFTIDCK